MDLKHIFMEFRNCFELRNAVKQWIKEKYSDVLKEKIELLDLPNGMELIQNYIVKRLKELKSQT